MSWPVPRLDQALVSTLGACVKTSWKLMRLSKRLRRKRWDISRPIPRCDQGLKVLTSHDRSLQLYLGIGWESRQVLTGLNKSWQVSTSLDRPQQVLTGLDKSWQVSTSLDRSQQLSLVLAWESWQVLTHFGWKSWQVLTGLNKSWQVSTSLNRSQQLNLGIAWESRQVLTMLLPGARVINKLRPELRNSLARVKFFL